MQPAALHFSELFARVAGRRRGAVQGVVDVTVRTEHTSRTAARISLLPANGSVASFSVSPLGVAAQLGGVCFQRFFFGRWDLEKSLTLQESAYLPCA